MTLSSVEEAIADIRAGKFVIIVDDEDRENEGDLTMAADRITPEAVNFMATHARGLVCVACEGWRRDELPRKFTRIRLTHRISGPGLDAGSVSRAVELSQTKYCSAMASLDPAIAVENVVAIEVPA